MAYIQLSAVLDGVAGLRDAIKEAKHTREGQGRGTLLFLDEIHRWNKSQQDSLLPYVENGTIVLVGATTENPSFEINAALLSRSSVLRLARMDDDALNAIIGRVESYYGSPLPVSAEAKPLLRELADGDGRYMIGLCEHIYQAAPESDLSPEGLAELLQRRAPQYDKGGDGRYNLLSALQKSIRGSDVQAALYYLARLIVAGEDMRTVTRRLMVTAAEDIGLADPNALVQATAAAEAFDRIGLPEGRLPLAQCVAYLATAPKSNASHDAIIDAMELAERTGSIEPPAHIINAPTKLMKEMGYKEGYVYDPTMPHSFSGQEFFPDKIAASGRPEIYKPREAGFEREIRKRMSWWDERREEIRKQQGS